MLAHLEPSSAITGGPWYTDNELDTEFIKLLMSACLKFITERVRLSVSIIFDGNSFIRSELSKKQLRLNSTLSYFSFTILPNSTANTSIPLEVTDNGDSTFCGTC